MAPKFMSDGILYMAARLSDGTVGQKIFIKNVALGMECVAFLFSAWLHIEGKCLSALLKSNPKIRTRPPYCERLFIESLDFWHPLPRDSEHTLIAAFGIRHV